MARTPFITASGRLPIKPPKCRCLQKNPCGESSCPWPMFRSTACVVSERSVFACGRVPLLIWIIHVVVSNSRVRYPNCRKPTKLCIWRSERTLLLLGSIKELQILFGNGPLYKSQLLPHLVVTLCRFCFGQVRDPFAYSRCGDEVHYLIHRGKSSPSRKANDRYKRPPCGDAMARFHTLRKAT